MSQPAVISSVSEPRALLDDGLWHVPIAPPALRPGDVHLWRAWLDDVSENGDDLAPDLSFAERERARQIRQDRPRLRFMARRALLRQLIGRYTKLAPASIELRAGRFGKPSLTTGPGSSLQFNMAYSDGLALFAFSRSGPVGVDVERVREGLAVNQIGRMFFPDAVAEGISTLPERQARDAFFACWTHREAYLKATGVGSAGVLPLPAAQRPVLPPCCLESAAADHEPAWRCVTLVPAVGYSGHLVIEAGTERLFRWEYPCD